MDAQDKDFKKLLSDMYSEIHELNILIKLFVGDSTNIKEKINSILDNDQKKKAYLLTNGENSARNIAEEIGVSFLTVQRWWRDWEKNGLVYENKVGRTILMKKNFDLFDKNIKFHYIDENISDVSNNNMRYFNEKKLRSILYDYRFFESNKDLVKFMTDIFMLNIVRIDDRKFLVDRFIDYFTNSDQKKKLVIIQALERRLKDDKGDFVNYFEEWESHIKGD
jgi:DNA-binding transcriptional regulator YhcF (GntR family)